MADDDDLAFSSFSVGSRPMTGSTPSVENREGVAYDMKRRSTWPSARMVVCIVWYKREVLERLCVLLVLDIELVPESEIARHVRPRSGCPNRDETIGLGERERVDQHGVNDAENRRVGSDGQRERQYRCRREHGCLSQRARSDAEILPESAERRALRERLA